MILQDITTGLSYTLKKHKKLPAFLLTATKVAITLDGKPANFIFHPGKKDGARVSLVIGNTRYHKDDLAFANWVRKLKAPKNKFKIINITRGVTVPKAAAKAPAKVGAKAPAPKVVKAPKPPAAPKEAPVVNTTPPAPAGESATQ